MLEKLILENFGPAPRLAMDPLAPRLNVITGDNGLGKTLLLDAAWFALTDSFANGDLLPAPDSVLAPVILGCLREPDGGLSEIKRTFDYGLFGFYGDLPHAGAPVVYARVDGGFSIFDPMRERTETDDRRMASWEASAIFHFTRRDVLEGLSKGDRVVCNGLIRDWTGWQKAKEPPFEMLTRALTALSPGDRESIIPGQPVRVRVDDARDHPTLRMGAGDVPITQLSAGYRRIISLAYLMTWAWHEHVLAARLRRKDPANGAILLIDEIDVHLHPRWQRTILRSILQVMAALSGNAGFNVQVLANTHSPLVLASMEPLFDPDQDALWKLDLTEHEVVLERDSWRRRGDVNMWLISDVFDLKMATSKEAESAMQEAMAIMTSETPAPHRVATVEDALRRTLSSTDAFWLEWRYWKREKGMSS